MNTQRKSATPARLLLGLLALCLPAAVVSAQTSAAAEQPPAAVVQPEAIAALDRMGEALRALTAFSLVSDASTEIVLENGQKVSLDDQISYRVRRPDKLYVEMKSDRRLRQIFYDGDTMTVYSPRLKYYASVDHVDATLADLAISASENYGIDLPLADLFFWGTEHVSKDVLTAAIYVGPGTLDGEAVDQYAFRQQGRDWQLWLSKTSALPRRIVITSLDDPAMPQFQARLRWDARTKTGSFAFTPPKGATRIEIVPVEVAVIQKTEEP